MHVKLTTSGGRRYVQLVESYRDEAGRVKKRTIATLGRAEQVDGSLDAVINGLLKITGREPMGAKPPAPTVSFESARALGNVWALTELWKSLGFSGLRRVFRRTRRTTDVEALIRLMVLNRLCDPESKLGVLRWVQTVALPDFGPRGSTLHPDFRPFSESASSAGAGLTAATEKLLWWHVCNSLPQA